MTSCYHVVCPKHKKNMETDFVKDGKDGKDGANESGKVTCPFCDDKVRPALFELLREGYQQFCDQREKMRKDPKLSKKINSYAGPHTKTQALLNDLQEFQQWGTDHPEERPIKRYVCMPLIPRTH
jgi:hypothetical protein